MSNINSNVWIVIAAYNEASVIRDVINGVFEYFDNIVVVDDASSDTTSVEILESGAWMIVHPINLGQGAALQTGIKFALMRGAEYVVTFDADGQHSIHDALGMLHLIQTDAVDIVLGSRFLGSAVGISKFRRLFLKCAAAFTGLLSGVWLTDAHNGLRVLSKFAAESISIKQIRMAHASEIVDCIGRNKLSFREYPVTITYTEYSLAKGQRLSNSISIVVDNLFSKFIR